MRDAPVGSKTPDSYLTRDNIFLGVATRIASAGLFYFGTGLHPKWWALWLAPIPVLSIAPRLRATVAFLLGSIAWLIGEMNQWNYVRHEIQLPPQMTVLYFLTLAA